MKAVDASKSGFYAECFADGCDWWGAIEDCWHPEEDPDVCLCGSCMHFIDRIERLPLSEEERHAD